MRVLWPRYSQRSGETDAVEGIALAIRKREQGPPVSHLCFKRRPQERDRYEKFSSFGS